MESSIKTIVGSKNQWCLKLGSELGSGGFGSVYAGYQKGNPSFSCAIKMQDLSSTGKSKARLSNINQYIYEKKIGEMGSMTFSKQIQKYIPDLIVYSLQHDNIVKIYDYCVEQTSNSMILYLIMEICEFNLKNHLEKKNPSLQEIKEIYNSIVAGINFLHKNNILHLDIKPENIMYNKGQWKLLDFSLCQKLENFRTGIEYNGSGTILYMAPNTLLEGIVDSTSDAYSVAIVLYEMIFQKSFYSDCWSLFEKVLQQRDERSQEMILKQKRDEIKNSSLIFDMKEILIACFKINKRPKFLIPLQ